MTDTTDNSTLNIIETDTGIYEYIRIKTEPRTDASRLHYLPQEQCYSCYDVGVCLYKDEAGKLRIFYCPNCHTHYRVKFTNKGLPIERR